MNFAGKLSIPSSLSSWFKYILSHGAVLGMLIIIFHGAPLRPLETSQTSHILDSEEQTTTPAWIAHMERFIHAFESRPSVSVDAVRNCFAKRSWLFLGDSTMAEIMHDLALFLSATHDLNGTLDYYTRATRFPGPGVNSPLENTYVLAKDVRDRETTVRFYNNHRNMTIESGEILVRHRFIGHRSLNEDNKGIQALPWLLENDLYIINCVREADVIILNSAAHDCARHGNVMQTDWIPGYAETLTGSIEEIRQLNPRARLLYKGSNLPTVAPNGCSEVDKAAQKAARTQSIDFIDIAQAVRPLYEAIPELYSMGVHVGAIHTYLCQNTNTVCGGLLAQLQLYYLLARLCSF